MAKLVVTAHRRMCVLCGLNPVDSKEHFYPEWMAKIIPLSGSSGYVEDLHVHDPFERTISKRKKAKAGDILTKKIREVCQTCNNGWMSALETAAIPLLRPIIAGAEVNLSEADQTLVARWITVKVVVAEHAIRSTAVTPSADRLALRERGKIPDSFRIYLGSHSSTASTGYRRDTALVSTSRDGLATPLVEGLTNNMQQVTFLLGRAFIQVNSSPQDAQLEQRMWMPSVHGRMRLWPIASSHFRYP